jgi:epoxyqueuosine reductase
MTNELLDWAARRGYRIAWGSWDVVPELFEEFSGRRRRAELDGDFDRAFLGWFSEPLAQKDGPPQWVVLVAVPSPAHSLTFRFDAKTRRLLLPPTYVGYRATTGAVLSDLSRNVFGGSPVEPLKAPLKAAAVRLGLVRYGRNNVTYAEGLGSYVQLVGGVTGEDLSEGAAAPRPAASLDACLSCTACADACPTQAIPAERFLLHAERCLVYFNERPDPFPEWISPAAHRCAIGCMACQQVCPANRGLFKVERNAATLTNAETEAILSENADHQIPALRSAEEKLASLGLTEPGAVLWRNVRAALSRRMPGDEM